MQVGFVGLGRMGAALVARLRRHKHQVVAYDRNPAAVKAARRTGARPAESLGSLMGQLRAPRVVWLMVPAGAPVGAVLRGLESHLAPGDIVIDGGNSRYTDSCERARAFQQAGVHFLDVGTSGGIRGGERGFCLMVGGGPQAFRRAGPPLRAPAAHN